eukprot:1182318-Prorocentrum_minimum.AAC.8
MDSVSVDCSRPALQTSSLLKCASADAGARWCVRCRCALWTTSGSLAAASRAKPPRGAQPHPPISIGSTNLYTVYIAAHNIRITAHNIRIAAHNIRIAAHNIRIAAHNIRIAAHNIRIAAHNIRIAANNIRIGAHNIRIGAHNGRIDARFDARRQTPNKSGAPRVSRGPLTEELQKGLVHPSALGLARSRRTMRGTRGTLLPGNLDFAVVNRRVGRNIFVPRVFVRLCRFSWCLRPTGVFVR